MFASHYEVRFNDLDLKQSVQRHSCSKSFDLALMFSIFKLGEYFLGHRFRGIVFVYAFHVKKQRINEISKR